MLATARRRSFSRGEVVFHAGDPADTLHLIAKGRFAVRSTTPLGDTAILAVLGPGEVFGELALVSQGAARSATVAALEPAETRSVHQLDVQRLRRENPQTNEVLVAILAAQVQRLSRHLVEALYVPSDRRVLKRLSELAAIYEEDGQALVPLTQEDIAGLAGTSRATVNKVLRDEEKRGNVELARGKTRVLDIPGLAERAAR